MGIADLLTMFQGASGAQAGLPQDGGQASAPQGVGAFLGGGDTDRGAQDQATTYAPPHAPPPAPQGAAPPIPSTPPSDAGSGGLSGFLSSMIHKANTADPNTGMSFVDRLGRLGGQMTDMMGDSKGSAAGYQAHGDANLAAAKRAKLQQMADALGMSPRERLIFTADPEKWTEANAKTLEPATLGGGQTRVTPGAPAYTAPLVGQENGEGYSATPDAIKDTGSLAMSPAQQAQDRAKAATEKAMELYHMLMAQNGARNADAHMVSATKPRAAGGGSGLPPGY